MAITSRLRYPLMALALLALLAAMWAGLQRMGWGLPSLEPGLASVHGALMVAGFLGTLISLERSVALGQPWTYLAPVLAAAAALLVWIGLAAGSSELVLASWVLDCSAALGLVAVFVLIVRRQPALFTYMMLAGAICWLAGNLLVLLGRPIHEAVYWWAGFLVLTIVGERLELSRLRRLRQIDERLFLAAAALLLAGLLISIATLEVGVRVAGLGMLALAAWLWRYDLARRTVRGVGLTRYIAVCMLSGYVWLGLGGLLAFLFGPVAAGPRYDAILHTVFLGFVMGMIFGHAPIILPAVLKLPVQYRPSFYGALILLQLSLLLRVFGDLATVLSARQWGGMLNVIAILAFLGMAAGSALSSRRALA